MHYVPVFSSLLSFLIRPVSTIIWCNYGKKILLLVIFSKIWSVNKIENIYSKYNPMTVHFHFFFKYLFLQLYYDSIHIFFRWTIAIKWQDDDNLKYVFFFPLLKTCCRGELAVISKKAQTLLSQSIYSMLIFFNYFC